VSIDCGGGKAANEVVSGGVGWWLATAETAEN